MAAERGVRYDFMGRDVSASRTAEKVAGRFDGLSSRLSRFGAFATRGLAVAGAAMVGLGTAGALMGVKTLAGLEQAEIGFTRMLGSGKAAQKFIGDLKRFAAKTPFELPGLIQTARGLLGAGKAAKDVIPSLRAWGDAAGALGLNQEAFGRTMLAVTQIMNKGKVQAEELLQITEAGIPIYPLLAKAMGKPVAEIQKLGEQGKLLAKDVLPALEAQMAKDYGGSMAAQSKTLTGLWSTFMDTLNIGLATALIPVQDELKAGLAKAIDVVGVALGKLPGIVSGVSGALDKLDLSSAVKKVSELGSTLKDKAKTWVSGIISGVKTGLDTGDWSPLASSLGAGLARAVGDGAALIGRLFSGINWKKAGETAAKIAVPFAAAFVTAIVGEILSWAVTHPIDALKLAIAIFPIGRVAGALSTVLGKIPIAGPILKWAADGLAKVTAPVNNRVGAFLRGMGRAFVDGLERVFPGIRTGLRSRLSTLTTTIGVAGLNIAARARQIGERAGQALGTGLLALGRAAAKAFGLVTRPFAGAGSWLYAAGRRIIGGLISGIASRIGEITSMVSRAAARVRAFWPFSPAKEGPLSGRGDPYRAGQNIMDRLAKGLAQGRAGLGAGMDTGMAPLAMAARPGPVAAAAAAGGPTIIVNVTVSPLANPKETGRQVVEAIAAYERGSGSSWRT